MEWNWSFGVNSIQNSMTELVYAYLPIRMWNHVSHGSKVKYTTKKMQLERAKIMKYGWIDGVKLKMTFYVLGMNFFLMELWGIGQLHTEFYTLLDLLELNLSGEELSWNVTWKWVIVQELNWCIGVGIHVWMEWFHSGISIPYPCLRLVSSIPEVQVWRCRTTKLHSGH